MNKSKTPIIAIVGPTASGKTSLGIAIAKLIGGEILCCDSRTVYKGMTIGTSAPSQKEQSGIPHHLLEIREPDKQINAAQFKEICLSTIENIKSRGKIPILVGGSGLYIDSIIFNYSYEPQDTVLRDSLANKTLDELQKIISEKNLELPINEKNPRHLISAIMNKGRDKDRELIDDCLVIGVSVDREVLVSSIKARTERMIKQGLETEVRALVDQYGWDIEPMRSIGYMEFKGYIENKINIEELKALINKDTFNYAKRQKTWFKRNKNIHWIEEQGEVVDLITTYLNKYGI
ncbi:MAG: tRNA (adenosine(37)-N6)-dimethylallyltransferase MiaA [bacterium]|jgi:tRNA dimethylallyltransferase